MRNARFVFITKYSGHVQVVCRTESKRNQHLHQCEKFRLLNQISALSKFSTYLLALSLVANTCNAVFRILNALE